MIRDLDTVCCGMGDRRDRRPRYDSAVHAALAEGAARGLDVVFVVVVGGFLGYTDDGQSAHAETLDAAAEGLLGEMIGDPVPKNRHVSPLRCAMRARGAPVHVESRGRHLVLVLDARTVHVLECGSAGEARAAVGRVPLTMGQFGLGPEAALRAARAYAAAAWRFAHRRCRR